MGAHRGKNGREKGEGGRGEEFLRLLVGIQFEPEWTKPTPKGGQ